MPQAWDPLGTDGKAALKAASPPIRTRSKIERGKLRPAPPPKHGKGARLSSSSQNGNGACCMRVTHCARPTHPPPSMQATCLVTRRLRHSTTSHSYSMQRPPTQPYKESNYFLYSRLGERLEAQRTALVAPGWRSRQRPSVPWRPSAGTPQATAAPHPNPC